MKQQVLRNPIHANRAKLTVKERREQWKITIFANIPIEKQQEIDKYLRNVERGRLPMSHDGADVTRQITPEQISKFLQCPDCKNGSKENPIQVSIQFKTTKGERRCVTICQKHWTVLAPTVVGWSGE